VIWSSLFKGHLSLVTELDYLVIGHVTQDLIDSGFTIGGTASYAARTARAMGCRVGVVTSASPDLDLSQVMDGVLVSCFPAATTTTFENIQTASGRRQVLHAVAETLTPRVIPLDWRVDAGRGIVHLGPVAQECDPTLLDTFGAAFVGLTPQGWMRRRGRDGAVSRCRWEGAERLLVRADAVVLSEEDIDGDAALEAHYAEQTRVLAVTRGAAGCTVHADGQSHNLPAPAVIEVDATGAGDIFAAAFFVRLQRGADPWMAACFANCVAAQSVIRAGLAGTPTSDDISHCEHRI
jgi:sugar/nucleoside kinase (ribokinase family)